MNKTLIMTLLLVLAVVFGAQLAASSTTPGRDDDADGERMFKRTPDVAAVQNDSYREECGSCHMAYPAGLLPARSWQKLMGGLDNHFGDNAELSAELNQALSSYLVANSADAGGYRRSEQITRSLGADAIPLRITDTPFFRHEHDEVPARLVQDNPAVQRFSNCTACHQGAGQGSFREREIDIPGYGRWDD